MPRKQRRTKIKNNSCNNSDEEPQEPHKPIYFKSKYNKVQTLKINEISDNF